jgi:N-acyl-D-amino-acid deacylase
MYRKLFSLAAASTLLSMCLVLLTACGQSIPTSRSSADLLIKGARIIDGAGNPWYLGEVAVADGRILDVGPQLNIPAADTIDASGLVLSPGFIDIHNHCNSGISHNPDAANFVRQGVTTLVGGPDGGSAVDMGEYLAGLDTLPLALNVCYTIGQGSIRREVMGMDDRAPTDGELQRMKELVDKAMRDGAIGISTGLKYVPGAYSSTEEVIELSKVAAAYGGYYTSHVREEGPGLIEACAEAVRIAEEANIPVNFTHHKAIGKVMWGSSITTLAMLDSARARGLDITADQYPYPATSTGLHVVLPAWSMAGGTDSLTARLQDPQRKAKIAERIIFALTHDRGGDDPLNVTIASCDHDHSMEGKSLRQILEERKVKPSLENAAELVISIVLQGGASCVYHCLNEDDVARIMRHPAVMHASDGTVMEFGDGVPHPRSYGTFPRVLGHYVRELGVIGLEDAIRKMTSLPAQRAGLFDRGTIRPGAVADLTLFDPERVIDKATFTEPHQYPVGIERVIVGGHTVFDGREMTGERPGKVIRRTDRPDGLL